MASAALTELAAALGSPIDPSATPVDALASLASTDGPLRVRPRRDDAYAELVLALAPAPAELDVAARVASLLVLEHDGWPRRAFYVDRVSDASERHRVYIRDEESLPGQSLATLGDVDELVTFFLDASKGQPTKEFESTVGADDPWESGTSSGGFVFETLIRASVSSQWAVAGLGAFVPRRPELAEEPLPVAADDHPRALCLHALRVVRLSGGFTLPETDAPTGDHADYIAHLRALEAAFVGVEPEFVRQAAKRPGPLRTAAKAWLKGLSQAQEQEPEPEPEYAPVSTELTPFEKRLRRSVERAIADLLEREEIEVRDSGMLLDELTRVAENARSVKHLVRKLVKTLVESEAIDEVYASDGDLETVFKTRLEEE